MTRNAWFDGILTGRVKSVNVQRQIHRVLGPYAVENLLDDAIGSDDVNFARLDNLEAAVSVVFVVTGAAQRRADAGVDVGVVGEESLL